jgi:putative hemolysin
VPAIPDTMDAIDAIPVLKTSPAHIAFVLDEYGHLEGVLTPADLLDAIVGGFADDPGEPEAAVRRDDGSWLIDGMMAAETMADMLRLKLPEARNYNTIAGFVLDEMQRLPTAGDWFEYAGWRFEVVDMDGRRIDKILAQPPAADEETTAPTSG